jgi:hypothetical protein
MNNDEIGGTCNMQGEMRNSYKILLGKYGRKSSLGRPRNRCENQVRLDLKEIGWEGVALINLTQDTDRGLDFEHSNEPVGSIKGGEFLD